MHVGPGKKGKEDNDLVTRTFHGFGAPVQEYRPFWSLADKKYAGSAALVRRSLPPPLSVRFRLEEGANTASHDAEGRIILLEFEAFQLLGTYRCTVCMQGSCSLALTLALSFALALGSPNNGVTEEMFQRRRDW